MLKPKRKKNTVQIVINDFKGTLLDGFNIAVYKIIVLFTRNNYILPKIVNIK